jgi:CubicO group peptidase (beta-lactamase class C family)
MHVPAAQSVPLDGYCDPRFSAVRDRFAQLLADGDETGGAVAFVLHGAPVVDLWGGWRDVARTVAWQRDSIAFTFSTTKWPAALTVLRLVDDGRLALDQPVGSVWPEYAVNGKEDTTIRHLLAHQAGVVTFPEPRPASGWADWDDLVAMLARSEPSWPPGTAHAEHVRTYGHLLGEVVRRVDGRTLGTFWREEIAGPLDIDFQIGLTEDEQQRCAEMEYGVASWADDVRAAATPLRLASLASPEDRLTTEFLNSKLCRSNEIPAINGHGTARGVARLWSATAGHDGVPPLLSEDLLAEATRPAMVGPDLVLGDDRAWCLGVQIDESYVGMGGLGGSDGLLDRGRGYAYGYVTRRLLDHDRAIALTDAFEACL